MANYFSCLVQILLLVCGPLALFGCAVYLLRTLFTYLVGHEHLGRKMLVFAFAPSTPIRVLGACAMAILFGHTISDVCFLNVRDPDGELGFVENSYNPRNPVAQLGKTFLALVPAFLSAVAVFAVLLVCFGNVLPDFMREVVDISYARGGLTAYAGAVGRMLAALFAASGWHLVLRLFGAALILVLSMGAFVSITELMQSYYGMLILGGIGTLFTAFLMLFDMRAQRLFIGRLHAYTAVLSGVYAVILIASLLLLLMGVSLFLFRVMTDKADERDAVSFEDEDEKKKKSAPKASAQEAPKKAPQKKEQPEARVERKPVKRVHPDGFTVYEYDVLEETQEEAEKAAQEPQKESADEEAVPTEAEAENQ